MRALILDALGARATLSALRALAGAGWSVGIAAPDAHGLGARSRWCAQWHPVPLASEDDERFVAAVNGAVSACGYELVFASSDVELLALSRLRSRIAADVPYVSHAALLDVMDKLALAGVCARVGLAAPRTWGRVEDAQRELGGPVMIKERTHGDAARTGPGPVPDPVIAEGSAAVSAQSRFLAQGAEVVVQEPIDGRLMALSVIADHDHRVRACVQQRALRTWPPDIGLSARAVCEPVDPDLAAGVQRLVEDVGWYGLAELQFLVGADGTPRLIDLNPRFYGSLALATAAGVNLPAIWAALATGRPVPAGERAQPGTRYQWLEADLRSARIERRGGLIRDVAGCLGFALRARHSIWSVRDPQPAFAHYRALAKEYL